MGTAYTSEHLVVDVSDFSPGGTVSILCPSGCWMLIACNDSYFLLFLTHLPPSPSFLCDGLMS